MGTPTNPLEPSPAEIAAAVRTLRRSMLPSQIKADGSVDWDGSAAVTIGRVDGLLAALADGVRYAEDRDRLIREARAALAAHALRDQPPGESTDA